MLPDSYRWAHTEDCAILYLRWGWVATVKPGSVELKAGNGQNITGPCGSIEQGKRFVERWVEATSRPQRYRRGPRRSFGPPLGPDPSKWPFSGASF